MGLQDRITQRRSELEQERRAAQAAEVSQQERVAAEAAEQRAASIKTAEIVKTFVAWAKQSGIKPEKLYAGPRVSKQGWPIQTIEDKSGVETRNGHPDSSTLQLYVDGTASWHTKGSGTVYLRPATPEEVETGIVDFVARSSSSVPWPE